MTSDLIIRKAARILYSGGVIAYPTEGVYGLGCLPGDHRAIERLLDIKGRSHRSGLILIAPIYELLEEWLAPTKQEYRRLTEPTKQPVTWVVTAAPGTPDYLTGGRPTVAVRLSRHPVVTKLCLEVDSALTSTSANRTGRPAAMSALATRRQLGQMLDYVVVGALGDASGPSEIRMAQNDRILRPGSIVLPGAS